MPDDLVRALIAHELAHAYWTAQQMLSGRYTHASEIEEDSEEEQKVREFNTSVLGHDEGLLGDWLWENRAGVEVDEAAIDEAIGGTR
jgi:hypothetical protein